MPFGYYDVFDHYWIVGGSFTDVWSSAVQNYVLQTDGTYLAWVAAGNTATNIASEHELWEVIINAGAPGLLTSVAGAQDELESYFTQASVVGVGAAHTLRDDAQTGGVLLRLIRATGTVGDYLYGVTVADTGTKLWKIDYLGNLVAKLADLTGIGVTDGGTPFASNYTIQLVRNDGVEADQVDGIVLDNIDTATAGNQQYSPMIRLRGRGWKTNATAGQRTVDFAIQNQPVQGAAAPTGKLKVLARIASDSAVAWTTALTITSDGKIGLNDTDASHLLNIVPGSNLTADRTLTIVTGDADRTLTISGDATVSQDYSTTGAPRFARLGLGAAADGTALLNLNGTLVHGSSTGVSVGTTTVNEVFTVRKDQNTTSVATTTKCAVINDHATGLCAITLGNASTAQGAIQYNNSSGSQNVFAVSYTDIPFHFGTNSSVMMTIGAGAYSGRIGINTQTPASKLHVYGADNSTVVTVEIAAVQANVTAADTFIDFRSGSGSEGSIAGTAVAGVIAYTTFTGAHDSLIVNRGGLKVGMVLEIDDAKGKPTFHKARAKGQSAKPKQQLFHSKICSTTASKKAVGVWGGQDKAGRDLVLSIGTGVILVANKGANLDAGDYLQSSNVAGHAEKQVDGIYRNTTIAKLTEPINWQAGESARLAACIYLGG